MRTPRPCYTVARTLGVTIVEPLRCPGDDAPLLLRECVARCHATGKAAPPEGSLCPPTAIAARHSSARRPRATDGGGSPEYVYDDHGRQLRDSTDAEAAAEVASSAKTFRDFGIAEPICAALEAEGITTAFPIQALTLPVALDGHDLIGQARTGTGKTLAFGIPILERLGRGRRGSRPRRARWSSCRPASWPSRSPTTCGSPGAGSAPTWSRSTAAAPTSPRSMRWRRSTSSSARPAGCSTWPGRAT